MKDPRYHDKTPDPMQTTRMWCINDACEVKDIRTITFGGGARCPECGAELKLTAARPQRRSDTY